MADVVKEKDGQFSLYLCGPQPKTCKCQCPNGPCEHKWDGPVEESDSGLIGSVTCSRCGLWAMDHSMWVGP